MVQKSAARSSKAKSAAMRKKQAPKNKVTKVLTQTSANGNVKKNPLASSPGGGKRKRNADQDDGVSQQRPRRRVKSVTEPSPMEGVEGEQQIINRAPTDTLTVLSFGSGECGELGLGVKRTSTRLPRPNPYLDPKDASKFHVVQLSCGGMHTIALTEDNKILTWGVNDDGALGRDTRWEGGLRDMDAQSDDEDDDEALNPHESIPTQVPASFFPENTVFVQVAAGDSCSFALTNTGLVYGWGTFRNSNGQKWFSYGHDGQKDEIEHRPILIPNVDKITQIVCGANHALALDTAGRVWGWGCGEQNQLGSQPVGQNPDTRIARKIKITHNPIKYIASGEYHSFAVDRKDNVWAWGLNSYGEAGHAKLAGSDSTLLPYPMKIHDLCGKQVIAIAGGTHHSGAVTADGQCLMWGRMDGGQLGIQFSQEQLDDPLLIRRDEYNKPRICLRPTAVPHLGHATFVACGTDHTIFVNQVGAGYSTGFGSSGQLGLGNDDDQSVSRCIKAKGLDGLTLTWAGAGGQFSTVAAQTHTKGR